MTRHHSNDLAGLASVTLLTLFAVLVAYDRFARRTGLTGDVEQWLKREMGDESAS
ncbi:hypothetical protein [Guyparkeria halopsychrophila]|uniref:hypothetical protein n=1 Tax=Guyparkeria halopsychrophila TaxID=3139421 RepID=UPI0037C723EC